MEIGGIMMNPSGKNTASRVVLNEFKSTEGRWTSYCFCKRILWVSSIAKWHGLSEYSLCNAQPLKPYQCKQRYACFQTFSCYFTEVTVTRSQLSFLIDLLLILGPWLMSYDSGMWEVGICFSTHQFALCLPNDGILLMRSSLTKVCILIHRINRRCSVYAFSIE